ncbi:carbon-phosphorus lyase complex subunit PhnI [Citrobacter freundii]
MYVAVKGGEKAIANAHALQENRRRGDETIAELSVAQIEQQMNLAVDRVMTEGGIADRELAALALKQASGDNVEAIFLLRAYRTTLAKVAVSEPVNSAEMRLERRISVQHYASKEIARRIGLLAQNATTPGDITVQELVARGRYPHQPLFTRWRQEDEIAVSNAMQATGITHLASQSVDTLSGGQRQRAWIAMVLAQETSIMLLDEPTTWLDISHQIDLLELLSELNREKGYTLAAVLHDLNQACRYATHLIALRDGKIIAEGAPKEIVTAQLIEKIYGLRCMIIDDPVAGTPLVVPLGRSK